MDKQNAIEVKDMSKSFKIQHDTAKGLKEKLLFWNRGTVEYHEVLKHISLNIKKGETVALIGTNGSGKSTLLKLMTKIYYPTSGTLETNGKLTSLLELGAGFHTEFTGRENIYFNASIFGLTRADIDKRIDEIIEFSELGDFINSPVRTYSSGMFMRLDFSVAINVDADILLIDEILAVGDQHFQDKCYAKLEELKKEGKTIVIVTHSLDVVKEMCTRAIWIYNGELKMDGEPSLVVDAYLKQIAEDHKNKSKKVSKDIELKADLFIDEPDQYEVVDSTQDSLLLRGWCVTNDDESVLKVSLDGKEVEEIERHPRGDVYAVYYEMYDGMLNADILGWKKNVMMSNLEKGIHKVVVSCWCEDGRCLASKEQTFTIE